MGDLGKLFAFVSDPATDRKLDQILTAVSTITTQLDQLETKIMSAISDFAAAQNTFNDQMDAAIAALQDDVKNLDDQIAALQASPGSITPSDQALLDAIQSRSAAIVAKLNALDALTPPAAPTGP